MTVLSDQAESADPVSYDTLILGLGNVLWADEGFGFDYRGKRQWQGILFKDHTSTQCS